MTTSKGIKPQETRDLTWKTPSTREGKTTGASQQQFTMSGVWLQRQRRRLTRREWINLGPSLLATGLRFAPSEVGLSRGRQNLDHNSTRAILANRHIGESGGCPVCPNGAEDIKHIMFTCDRAKEVWKELGCWEKLCSASLLLITRVQ
jgi:hypothetical protein